MTILVVRSSFIPDTFYSVYLRTNMLLICAKMQLEDYISKQDMLN